MRAKQKYHLENPTWCPGCGIYAIFEALKGAVSALHIDPEDLVIVSGIGSL